MSALLEAREWREGIVKVTDLSSKTRTGLLFLVEVNGLAAALKALW